MYRHNGGTTVPVLGFLLWNVMYNERLMLLFVGFGVDAVITKR